MRTRDNPKDIAQEYIIERIAFMRILVFIIYSIYDKRGATTATLFGGTGIPSWEHEQEPRLSGALPQFRSHEFTCQFSEERILR